MNLAPRPDRWPFTFEKWYLDTVTADDSVLLVYCGRLRLAGVALARVTAELYQSDGTVRRGGAAARRPRGGEDWLCFGPLKIDGATVSWRTADLSGEIEMVPRFPPATLRRPFLSTADGRIEWTVEVPDAEVRGHLHWPGGGVEVRGRGYRDRVWLDLKPWRFPIRELRWGRAVAGVHAAVWVRAETAATVVEAGWHDGAERPAAVGLEPPRTLLETDVVDLEGLRLGPVRPLLRRLSGNPHEIKYLAAARLDDEQGVAIHEVVRWS